MKTSEKHLSYDEQQLVIDITKTNNITAIYRAHLTAPLRYVAKIFSKTTGLNSLST